LVWDLQVTGEPGYRDLTEDPDQQLPRMAEGAEGVEDVVMDLIVVLVAAAQTD